jgi:adenosylhomocysteine nucleosidase
LEAAAEVLPDGSKAITGVIASGDIFVDDSALKRRIVERHGAAAAEMEGAAVAHVCTVNRVPFGVIRCISDLANDVAYDDMESFEQRAARKSADILCDAIGFLMGKEKAQ